MTIRVLQIVPTLDQGGAEKQLTLLATGLPRDQFEVHVALLTRAGPYLATLQQHEIPVFEVNKAWKIDPFAYLRLKRHIRDLRPDIVHTWLFAANSYGRQAAFAAGVDTVIAGERCVDEWKSSPALVIDRWLAKRTARILTNSNGVKDFYVAKGLPAQKFDVIPNGISVPAAPAATRESALACAGMEEGDFVIGAVGRLWPQKRQKDLIWAAHLLEEAGHRIRLLIIGDGPQRWRLERYARQVFPDRDTVVFLGHRDDVASLMPHFDCFWLASGYEGQSNALMEAMSCGVPAVVSDIAGNRDLVVPDETGLLVAVGDRAGFTKQTHRLIEDPDLRARLANNSQQRMREQFSVQRMVERYGQLYQSLVDART